MTKEESVRIAGENPDFLIQDMFEAIERGDYPTWNVYVQVMDPEQAENYRWNIFDMTKVWPHQDFPLRQIGKLTLNHNVKLTLLLGHDMIANVTFQSPTTISPILNRPPSHHLIWYLGLRHLQIQVCVFFFPPIKYMVVL